MWGELLSAGATLLGGLFGKKKKQETTTRINYQQMADDAAAAGFNPLTAIRNGGSAGFTTTTAPTVSAMPEVLSQLGGILGGALDKSSTQSKRSVERSTRSFLIVSWGNSKWVLNYRRLSRRQGPTLVSRQASSLRLVLVQAPLKRVHRSLKLMTLSLLTVTRVKPLSTPITVINLGGGLILGCPLLQLLKTITAT